MFGRTSKLQKLIRIGSEKCHRYQYYWEILFLEEIEARKKENAGVEQ